MGNNSHFHTKDTQMDIAAVPLSSDALFLNSEFFFYLCKGIHITSQDSTRMAQCEKRGRAFREDNELLEGEYKCYFLCMCGLCMCACVCVCVCCVRV